MIFSLIKRLFIFLVIFAYALGANAQQDHFIYLQTENGQPFYVKMNNKVLSSSQSGYIIVPQLSEGIHELAIGFPKNEYAEAKFNVTVENNNEGFLVKNLGDKGWSLFNLQTLDLISSSSKSTVSEVVTTKVQDDRFSTMLADVVQDQSILVKEVQKKEPEQKTDPVIAVTETVPVVVDNAATVNEPTVAVIPVPDPVITTQNTNVPSEVQAERGSEKQIPAIRRILLLREKTGLEMVYVDRSETRSDTIRIFLPAASAASSSDSQIIYNPETVAGKPVIESKEELTITPTIVTSMEVFDTATQESVNSEKDSVIIKTESEKPAVIIYDPQPKVTGTEPVSSINKDSEIIVLPKVVTSSAVNSDCKNFAKDADFLRVRKKMAAETNNDAMIQVAKKEFRIACFSTEQIRNLSYLFLDDEGKYMFFDAAYAFTADSDKYETLQDQLSDPYYLNRFKAMINKP